MQWYKTAITKVINKNCIDKHICFVYANFKYLFTKDAFRLDAKQREAKVGDLRQPSRVVDYVTREDCQPSRVFVSGC